MQRCSNELEMFGKGIFSFMCFQFSCQIDHFHLPHFIIKNTQTVSALKIFHFNEDSYLLQCKICLGS